MITLSPFLKARGRDDHDDKEISRAEKQAEALNRIVSILLQGISLHGFNYDPLAAVSFENSVRKLRMEFEEASDEAAAMLIAGNAIRLMEDYNRTAERHLAARQNEMEAVLAMLSEALLEASRATPEFLIRLKEIERDISLSTRPDSVAAARSRLAQCLSDLRVASAADGPFQHSGQTFGETDTDPVTGLPNVAFATAAIGKIWNRRMDYYAVTFAVERLETVNLRFGFQAGDQMLRRLSEHIARQLISSDQLFRWRGPCLMMLVERRLPETLVAAEISRITPVRLESAIAVRDREVMVPISAAWHLVPLSGVNSLDELARKLNEFAGSRSRQGRKVTAAGM